LGSTIADSFRSRSALATLLPVLPLTLTMISLEELLGRLAGGGAQENGGAAGACQAVGGTRADQQPVGALCETPRGSHCHGGRGMGRYR